jgi:hypothetical protein
MWGQLGKIIFAFDAHKTLGVGMDISLQTLYEENF